MHACDGQEPSRSKLVVFLLQQHDCINTVDGCKQTALHYAIAWCNIPVIKVLLICGIDSTIADYRGRTVLDSLYVNIQKRMKMLDLITNWKPWKEWRPNNVIYLPHKYRRATSTLLFLAKVI